MLEAYVLNPTRASYGLSNLSSEYFGHTMIEYAEVAGKGKKEIPFDEVTVERATTYAAEDAHLAWLLREKLAKKLTAESSLDRVYREIEQPLMRVLMAMEEAGIAIDTAQLEQASREYEQTLRSLEERIHEEAGTPFNVNSPAQLARILFEELGLRVVRRTKTGPSTDRAVLEELAGEHPVPGLILQFRELAKLKSTYIDALPGLVNVETGRIHSSWNQTGAATGRLSSSEPNLQNIPIRTEEGRKIRKAFVAAPGHVFVAADYSQMELRVMAHVTGDPILVETFLNGEDVHTRTAQEVFGDSNEDLRRRAKAINFGIIYGLTRFGLSKQLGIGRDEAQEFIERYLDRYSGVRDYMEETVELARKQGYVETLFGRRRQILQIHHRNKMTREGAERAAINAPIQGTAADVMKIAMIAVDRRLEEESLKARVVAQIHDELLLEAPEAEATQTRELLVDAMQSAADFQVPLSVEVETGPTWADV
jgi:DNA polymerase-1